MNEDRKSDYSHKLMGALIRDARSDAHMNQLEMSERAGIARTHLAMIENGRKSATVDTLWKIATALDIPLSSLIQKAEAIIDSLPGEDPQKEIDDVIHEMEHSRKKRHS